MGSFFFLYHVCVTSRLIIVVSQIWVVVHRLTWLSALLHSSVGCLQVCRREGNGARDGVGTEES